MKPGVVVNGKISFEVSELDRVGACCIKRLQSDILIPMRIGAFVLVLAVMPAFVYAQETKVVEQVAPEAEVKIQDRQKEIAELDKKIHELTAKRNTTAAEADIIEQRVQQLNAQLKKAHLELEKTELTLQSVEQKQVKTTKDIETTRDTVAKKRDQLKALMRALYQHEQEPLIKIFFNEWSLSDILAERYAYEEIQKQTIAVISEVKQQEQELQQKQQELEEQEADLGQLANLLEVQKADVADQQSEQKQFLASKETKQHEYENLLKEAREAREEIQQDIFTLKSSKVKVSLNNASDMAKFAGSKTGVRAALIMAVLKVESNVGSSIGTGKFPDDMQPQSREAFVRITKKLGLDPNTAPISRRPASYRGWGGAMGPAQIMPATWEGIEGRLEQLMGKSPVNPYELSDAFMATGVFLADRGAASPAQEREAVGRYIAGPNWQYYSWYIDRVMAVAEEYSKEGV